MKNKNTMDLLMYVIDNIIYSIISLINYQTGIFICFPNLTYNNSHLLCYGILSISVLAGVLLTYKRRRNNLSTFVNIFFGLGLYSIGAYYKYFEKLIIGLLIIAMISMLIYSVVVIRKRINFKNRNFKGNKKLYSIKVKSKHIFLGSRTILALCMAILLVPFSIKCLFGYSLFQAQISAEYYSIDDEYVIENKLDELSQFEDSIWIYLTLQEKLDLMQIVANIEANYLGISHELNVVSMTLEDTICAYYNDSKYLIVVNTTYLENSLGYDALDTVCHESYHAYQYRQVDLFNQLDTQSQELLMFYEVSLYKEEFEGGYADSSDSYLDYYTQTCETNARDYAEDAVRSYKYLIDNYAN